MSQIDKLFSKLKGGAGSGNFGHSGRPGKIGGSLAGSGGSLTAGIEEIAGRQFNPAAAKTIGNRTSNLMSIDLGSKRKPAEVLKELDRLFTSQGMKKFPGRTKAETMYGNQDQSKIVTVKKRSVKIAGRTMNSILVEAIESNV